MTAGAAAGCLPTQLLHGARHQHLQLARSQIPHMHHGGLVCATQLWECCHAFILAVPGSPKEAPIIDGPPGEGEEGLQKLLFVANYAGAVDAAIEVRAVAGWPARGVGVEPC